jgi:hypothetical protein
MTYLRDASDQTAEHNDAMRAEAMDDRDAWFDAHDDGRPTRAELDAEEADAYWRGRERHEEWWRK